MTEALVTRHSVFVPGSFPEHTYVHRKFVDKRTGIAFDPELSIREALDRPGIIVQVIGPSKSGKTLAVENCVGKDRLLEIAGSHITTGLGLWEIVARKLRVAQSRIIENGREDAISGEMKLKAKASAAVLGTEAEIAGRATASSNQNSSLNFVADAFTESIAGLRSRNLVLFLDDFHTIPKELQRQVAAQLKAAAQALAKVCLAEVPQHSTSPVSALPDLTGRIQTIEFAYWSQTDLASIADIGFRTLNAVIGPATVDAFSLEAAGSPQLMQSICLNAAHHAGLERRTSTTQQLRFQHRDIRTVLLSSQAAANRLDVLRALSSGPEQRGTPRLKYHSPQIGEVDAYEAVLGAIALSPPTTHLRWNQGKDTLLSRLERVLPDANARPSRAQVTRTLEQMHAIARERFPDQSILEWLPDDGLHILDPYFLFFLRWDPKFERLHYERPDEA